MWALFEHIEPLLFAAVLLVIYVQVRRYRRIIPQRYAWLKRLHLFLPLLALLTLADYGLLLRGGPHPAAGLVYLLEALAIVSLVVIIFSLILLLRFGRPATNVRVLAIGAHPDDIEFGCGATLMRYREQGHEIHALVLSAGERGAEASRVREAEAAAKALNLTNITVRDFPDTRLLDHYKEVKNAIEDAIRALNPDIVFTHNPHDAHSDHQVVFQATLEAARGTQSILCYENPNTPTSFRPNYFVDVSYYLDDKINALKHHRSQSHKAYFSREVIAHIAGFRGAQARVRYAEGFEAVRFLDRATDASLPTEKKNDA